MNIYEASKKALQEKKCMRENPTARVKVKVETAGTCTLMKLDGSHTLVDIVKEGRALHHCAGSSERYFDRIESRETYICFLRRQEAPGIPFYTIEVEPGGTIRQHRSYYDEEPGIEEIRVFLKEWQKAIRKRLTEEDKKLAKISKIKREANIAELEEKKNIRVLQGLAEDFLEAEEIEKELEAV